MIFFLIVTAGRGWRDAILPEPQHLAAGEAHQADCDKVREGRRINNLRKKKTCLWLSSGATEKHSPYIQEVVRFEFQWGQCHLWPSANRAKFAMYWPCCLGGMALSNHSDTSQSWISVSVYMRRSADSDFLWECHSSCLVGGNWKMIKSGWKCRGLKVIVVSNIWLWFFFTGRH